MSKIRTPHVFTSESVSEGHPDKLCDQVSDGVLDACLAGDPNSRVACESLATTNLLIVAGEITTQTDVDYEAVAREVAADIGYVDAEWGLDAANCEVQVRVHTQSPDISQGVTEGAGRFQEQGAGDQGMMFGYASDETEELMPAPILYAHRIVEVLANKRKCGCGGYEWLRPDSKSQVSIEYVDGRPVRVKTVVVSHQHSPDMQQQQLEDLVREVSTTVIPADLMSGDVEYYCNPTGRFVTGGPHGDCGVTGRKIIVDTYGGVGCHGGGAFSGKDPSKVDRSAAYMCRYMAKNIVAAGLAEKCEIQVAYAIGVARPLSVNVDTFGTGNLPDEKIQSILENTDIFDLRPAGIIAALGLKTPNDANWSYRQTAAYGHFGREMFPWEKTNQVQALQDAAGKVK